MDVDANMDELEPDDVWVRPQASGPLDEAQEAAQRQRRRSAPRAELGRVASAAPGVADRGEDACMPGHELCSRACQLTPARALSVAYFYS